MYIHAVLNMYAYNIYGLWVYTYTCYHEHTGMFLIAYAPDAIISMVIWGEISVKITLLYVR